VPKPRFKALERHPDAKDVRDLADAAERKFWVVFGKQLPGEDDIKHLRRCLNAAFIELVRLYNEAKYEQLKAYLNRNDE
jgi:hypothetical protein